MGGAEHALQALTSRTNAVSYSRRRPALSRRASLGAFDGRLQVEEAGGDVTYHQKYVKADASIAGSAVTSVKYGSLAKTAHEAGSFGAVEA